VGARRIAHVLEKPNVSCPSWNSERSTAKRRFNLKFIVTPALPYYVLGALP